MESEFAFDQPTVDPVQAFEDECLQSFVFTSSHVDLDAFDNFDDVSTFAGGPGDGPNVVSNKDCKIIK